VGDIAIRGFENSRQKSRKFLKTRLNVAHRFDSIKDSFTMRARRQLHDQALAGCESEG
jgi:hypothetical protein